MLRLLIDAHCAIALWKAQNSSYVRILLPSHN